jgi:hypothetical protein
MPNFDDAAIKTFFAALYDEHATPAPATGAEAGVKLNELTNRILLKRQGEVSSGDQALQNLMFNYIHSSPGNVAAGKPLTAVLGGSQGLSIAKFSERFPTTDIDALVAAARAEGYDVEILPA